MNKFETEVLQRLTSIEIELKNRPCIQHSADIEQFKKERWFFGGIAAAVTTIITFIFK
jgi:hypothetical protein